METSLLVGIIAGFTSIVCAGITVVSARALNRAQGKLSQTLKEHEVRFSKLHERRVEVIAGLFGKLVALVNANRAVGFSAGGRNKKELDAYDAAELAVVDFYEPNEIFFDEPTATKISALLFAMRKLRTSKGQDPADTDDLEQRKLISLHREKLIDQIPMLLKALTTDFRILLGVSAIEDLPAKISEQDLPKTTV
jgi:hypothetical protein